MVSCYGRKNAMLLELSVYLIFNGSLEMETRLLGKVVTKSLFHQQCNGSFSVDSGLRVMNGSKLA